VRWLRRRSLPDALAARTAGLTGDLVDLLRLDCAVDDGVREVEALNAAILEQRAQLGEDGGPAGGVQPAPRPVQTPGQGLRRVQPPGGGGGAGGALFSGQGGGRGGAARR